MSTTAGLTMNCGDTNFLVHRKNLLSFLLFSNNAGIKVWKDWRVNYKHKNPHCLTRHLNLQGDSGIFTNMNIILIWLKGLETDPSGKSTCEINNLMSRIWMDLILDGRGALDIFCLEVVLLSKVYLNWSRLATYLTVIMYKINSWCF